MSRLLVGDSLQKNMAAGRVVVAEFGTKVQTVEQGFFDKLVLLHRFDFMRKPTGVGMCGNFH